MRRPTLLELSQRLARRETTSRALVEESFAGIADPAGEGARAFLTAYADRSRAEADAVDAARARGEALPATADAEAVVLMRRAGFVIVAKTNMTEFAYSGLGVNPHYGTPLSPWDRDRGHIPGGSTSGGSVGVADGMIPAALGTDTGGSCRTPQPSAGSSASSRRRGASR
jgi:aspartyl-tRNA(Asn)/glutamyl-tRNA(Gln) amidotransferase subunit A